MLTQECHKLCARQLPKCVDYDTWYIVGTGFLLVNYFERHFPIGQTSLVDRRRHPGS